MVRIRSDSWRALWRLAWGGRCYSWPSVRSAASAAQAPTFAGPGTKSHSRCRLMYRRPPGSAGLLRFGGADDQRNIMRGFLESLSLGSGAEVVMLVSALLAAVSALGLGIITMRFPSGDTSKLFFAARQARIRRPRYMLSRTHGTGGKKPSKHLTK
jgi:hypothetical protein